MNARRTPLPVPGTAGSQSANAAIVLYNAVPVFPGTGTETSPHPLTFATGTTTAVTLYNAQATDNSRGADTGITFALGCTDVATFMLDPDNGVLTPASDLGTAMTYSVTITATDEAGNESAAFYLAITVAELPTVIITDNIAIGTPTTRLTDTANIADGALTFTISFSEDVTGFTDVIEVTGHDTGTTPSLDPSPNSGTTYTSADTFTLVVTPLSDTNDGTLTITVPADAATAVSGTGRNTVGHRTNRAMTRWRRSIRLLKMWEFPTAISTRPTRPPVCLLQATPNATPRSAGVILCVAGGGGDECGGTGSGRTTRDVGVLAANLGGTWSYLLTVADIAEMGEGDETLTATTIDTNGNPSNEIDVNIIVDTMPPAPAPDFSADAIATDGIINLAERTDGVTVRGTTATDVTAVTLCADATDVTDSTCTDGDDLRRRRGHPHLGQPPLELRADHR